MLTRIWATVSSAIAARRACVKVSVLVPPPHASIMPACCMMMPCSESTAMAPLAARVEMTGRAAAIAGRPAGDSSSTSAVIVTSAPPRAM